MFAQTYAPSSVLAQGHWVKMEVKESGVYRLTFADLRSMGFEQPQQVAVYGYGAHIQNENLLGYIDDLPKLPVWRTNGDDLLFFATGTVQWNLANGVFLHTNNPYASAAYYFLSDVDGAAPPIEVQEPPTESPDIDLQVYDDFLLHESDLASVSGSGRELFGEPMDGSRSLDIRFAAPGIVPEAPGKVSVRFISRPTATAGAFSMAIAGESLIGKAPVPFVRDYDTKAVALAQTVDWINNKTESPVVTLSYAAASHTNSRLDYLRLQFKRRLQPYGACTRFRALESVGHATRFLIANANAQTLVIDVTNPTHPIRMNTSLNGQTLTFSIPAGDLREFALLQTDAALPAPVKVADLPNQNLHALTHTNLIILVPPIPALRAQAERLAKEHRDRDNLTVEVIDATLIYNEFSGGAPDATAYRHFLKMLHERADADAERLQALLLFGDGLFDNRAQSQELAAQYPQGAVYQKFLLTYQSIESIASSSFTTDDYFGFLSDDNHIPDRNGNYKAITRWKLDIGVGRIPVRSGEEAKQVVDKLIDYRNNTQLGAWKNNICFVADDGNSADIFSITHAQNSDLLAQYLEENHPQFLVEKLYFDAYKKDFSAPNNPYPTVRNRLQKLLKEGLLVVNYSGHGGPTAWSDEKVLTVSDATAFNHPRLPLWITATCDFAPFDATQTSAGEQIMLSHSGGVALFSTTRLVYRDPNFIVNEHLIQHLFNPKDGQHLSFGDIFKEAKNSQDLDGDANKLNFILLGDPVMKLAYPKYTMKLTAVNGLPPDDDNPFTLKALDRVTLEGEVLNELGQCASGFQGDVYPTVLDSKVSLQTLDNNSTGEFLSYTDYPNTLFFGNNIVTDGRFRFAFTVPKDISYSGDFGKISLYAADPATGNEAQGAYTRFRVGGTGISEQDSLGPAIYTLYLNDETFTPGASVNPTPLFVVTLWDENGVNLGGSSVGHDMTLTIDGRTALTYSLNEYYRNIPDQDGLGIITFSIPTLPPGEHFAEFVVWDVYNNSTHAGFSFLVDQTLTPRFAALLASPNPARDQTHFLLSHDRPETNLDVQLYIFNTSGRLVRTIAEKGASDFSANYTITWDLTDNHGVRLPPGLYFCRATIAAAGSRQASQSYKLVILAQ
ncbi:MAG: type IX secretion system sortase PorU [Tannerellaceae bacterium]|nr:type IX secretion system sortase PorU [Tannerellaceae bacterium]